MFLILKAGNSVCFWKGSVGSYLEVNRSVRLPSEQRLAVWTRRAGVVFFFFFFFLGMGF